jgi:hypothetical protein
MEPSSENPLPSETAATSGARREGDASPLPSSTKESETSRLGALRHRAESALVILGVLSPVVATVSWVVSRAHFDLVVWIDETTLIYPTPETGDRPLSLAFDQTEARSVALSRVRIRNEGKQSIGAQSNAWWLDLYVAEPGRISLRKETPPRISSNRTRFLPPAQQAANRLRLHLGLLEPGAEVDLEAILVNVEGVAGYPDIKVDTDLSGIPLPLVTEQSVTARFADAAALPSWFAILFAIVGRLAWRVLRRKERLGAAMQSELDLRPSWGLVLQIPKLIFFTMLAAAFLAAASAFLAYGVWLVAS